MAQRPVDPENQGLTSALLEGAMRTNNLQELKDLVETLHERNAKNLSVLYELAQEDHPEMPTWDDLLKQLEAE